MKQIIFFFIVTLNLMTSYSQGVGIGTTMPLARLHVTDSNVVFSATGDVPGTPGNPPLQGVGRRMMWYPDKAAFRVGRVSFTQWDKDNIGVYSFASGNNTTAMGIISTAMGNITTASGFTSTAMGFSTTASGSNSTAMGSSTTASGSNSTAMGNSTTASGIVSTAMGDNTDASGIVSTAMGNSTTASGSASTAMGDNTDASGIFSTAMGRFTTARGFAGTVIGMFNNPILSTAQSSATTATPLFIIGNGNDGSSLSNAMVVLKNGNVGINNDIPMARLHVKDSSVVFSAAGSPAPIAGNPPLQGGGRRMMWYADKAAFRVGFVNGSAWDKDNIGIASFASGLNTTASESSSTAMGSNTNATGVGSTAMGNLTNATGFFSTTMGQQTISRGYAGTVIGIYNDPILSSPQSSVTSTSPLFIIGNGEDNNRSNAMVVLKSGNVGLGTDAPEEKLVINSGANTEIQLEAGGVDKGFVQLSGNNIRIGTYSTNATGNFVVRTNGNDQLVIFPSGNATLSGTLTQSSDARFKQNIEPISNSLNKLMQLKGYQYNWRPELKKDARLQIGLIAQNVEAVYPELVSNDANGMKSVAYQNLVPVMIEAIKDQQKQIDELKNNNTTLQVRLQRLEAILLKNTNN